MIMANENDNQAQSPEQQQPNLGMIDDDAPKTLETVAEGDVKFKSQEIKRHEAEFKLKEKSKSQKRLEEFGQRAAVFFKWLWQGWHKWVLISMAIVLLGGGAVLGAILLNRQPDVLPEDAPFVTVDQASAIYHEADMIFRSESDTSLQEAIEFFRDHISDAENNIELQNELRGQFGLFLWNTGDRLGAVAELTDLLERGDLTSQQRESYQIRLDAMQESI